MVRDPYSDCFRIDAVLVVFRSLLAFVPVWSAFSLAYRLSPEASLAGCSDIGCDPT